MEKNTCSICLEEVDNNITVCKCKNPVHISCLIEWLNHKNDTICEICNTQYNIEQNVLQEYINIPEINNIPELEDDDSPNSLYNHNNNYTLHNIYHNYINRRNCNKFYKKCILPTVISGVIFCICYIGYLLYNSEQESKNNK